MNIISFILSFSLLAASSYCFSEKNISNRQKTPEILSVEPKTIKIRHAQDIVLKVKNNYPGIQLSITPGGAYVQSELATNAHSINIGPSGYNWLVMNDQIKIYKAHQSIFELIKTLDIKHLVQKIAINGQNLLAIDNSEITFFQFDDNFNLTEIFHTQLEQSIVNVSLSKSNACLILADNQLLQLNLKSKYIFRSSEKLEASNTVISAKSFCVSAGKKKITLWKPQDKQLIIDSYYLSSRFINKILATENKLILANGNTGVTFLDLDNKLEWLGSYNKLGNISQIAVWKNQLLAADDRGAITLLDISHVENPLLTSDFNLHEKMLDLVFFDHIAYALVKNKLLAIDFSANSSPIISTLGVNQGGSRRSFIVGNILYVADWFSGLHLYDISIPHAPRLLSSYHTSGSPKGVVVRNEVAFVADDDHGLQIIDVSNPLEPTRISELPLTGLAYTMKLVDNLLYIASHHGGFHIVDVSDQMKPKLIGSYDTPGKAWALEYQSGLLYVADDSSGLMIFDVKNPAKPKLVNQFNPGGFAEDVVLKGDKAYIAFFDLGLMVLDINDPLALTLLATLRTPGNARGIEIRKNLLYLASWEAGVHIIDITNSETPEIVGHYDTKGATWGVSVKSPILYAMDWWGGVKVLDVSKQANPVLLGQYQTTGKIKDILYQDGFIYTAHGSRGLQVYDASNSLNPVWATGLDFDGDAQSIALNGNLALIASGDGGLVIADIRNPFQLKWLSQLTIPSSADLVQSIGQTAFVATKNGDLYLIDISSPKHPQLIAQLSATTQAMKSSAQRLFHLNKAGIINEYSVNKATNLWDARLLAANFNAIRMAIRDQHLFLSDTTGQISRYQFKQSGLFLTTKIKLPDRIIELYVRDNKLYATASSNKLYVFDITKKNMIQLQYTYPTIHEIERITTSKDGIFFSGESSIASGKLLPDVAIAHTNDQYTAKIPSNMPLGAYDLNISNAQGEQITVNNAFSVAFPKLKSKFSLEDFKKKLAEKNLQGKAPSQP